MERNPLINLAIADQNPSAPFMEPVWRETLSTRLQSPQKTNQLKFMDVWMDKYRHRWIDRVLNTNYTVFTDK